MGQAIGVTDTKYEYVHRLGSFRFKAKFVVTEDPHLMDIKEIEATRTPGLRL